jgi:hypothetical protein
VAALNRPSVIHCRTKSLEMGPYSLPSLPMILYMAADWRRRGHSSRRQEPDAADFSFSSSLAAP